MASLSIALLLAALQGASAPKAGEVYQRVLARALQRAEAGILASVRFDIEHGSWADPWVVRSEHYEVRTTKSYAQARAVADSAEYMRAEFVKLLGEGRGGRGGKQAVWVFPTLGAYTEFGNANGAEHSSILGSYYASEDPAQAVATYQFDNPTLLGMWVTHSAVHQFLDLNFGAQRTVWIDEGLASYFALFWDWSYGAKELERLKQERTFLPLARLVRESLQDYGGPSWSPAQAHVRFIELGMLFQFLLNSCESTRNGAGGDPTTGPFQEFLRLAVRGQDVSGSEFARLFEAEGNRLEQEFRVFEFDK